MSCGLFKFIAGVALIALPVSVIHANGHEPEPTNADGSFEIRLKNRHFTPQHSSIRTNISAKLAVDEHKPRFLMVQFTNLPTLNALKNLKLKPIHYVSENTLLVAVPPSVDLATIPDTRWAGALQKQDRLSKRAERILKRASPVKIVTMLVEGFPGASSLNDTIWSLGASLEDYPSLPNHVKLVSGTKEVFYALADHNEIAWIAKPNTALAQRLPVKYCPGPITEYGTVANFTAPSIGWDGPGQQATEISYHFRNDTLKVIGTEEHLAVQRAFQEWSKYVNVTFSQTTKARQRRSIDLLWDVGVHGDGVDFDGPSQTLAHAFFPTPDNRESIAGDLHFDDDEPWGIFSDPNWTDANTDVYTVALHEIGHSLGLAHSDASWAVMAPFYAGPVQGLQSDDVLGARAIYSATSAPVPTAPGCSPSFSFNAFDPTLPLITLGCSFGLIRLRKRK